MMRNSSHTRNALFTALGMLAVLILFAAGICSGIRQKLMAKSQARSMGQKSTRTA